MATRPRTENNPFAYGMRLLAVFYNEMEKNKNVSYDIFNKSNEKKNNKKDKEVVLYKKESFIKKIISKIKEIFKK